MIRLTIPLAPSRHRRNAKAAMVEALRRCTGIREVTARRYRVEMQFFGKWDNKDGTPKRRDPDSAVIVIMDAIAEAAGIDDKWLNRRVSWDTVHSDRETAVVRLTPI